MKADVALAHSLLLGQSIEGDLWTAPKPVSVRKPINITRSKLRHPVTCLAGDKFHLTFTSKEGVVQNPPEFDIDRPMVIDSVTKFEVIDEFGLDVGIGFVLGKATNPSVPVGEK